MDTLLVLIGPTTYSDSQSNQTGNGEENLDPDFMSKSYRIQSASNLPGNPGSYKCKSEAKTDKNDTGYAYCGCDFWLQW